MKKSTLEQNAVKIVLTVVLAWGMFFGMLYVKNNVTEILSLQTQVRQLIVEKQDTDKQVAYLTFGGLLQIIEQLDEVIKGQNYIIDQNRNAIKKQKEVVQNYAEINKKPTYEELKSHTVYITGCSNKKLPTDVKNEFLLEDKGFCWGGTGGIVKTTDTETYILTNNHVAGLGEPNVTLYIQEENKRVEATVVKNHQYADMAVLKISGKLENKTPIKKIAFINPQDSVYIVGNPLGNKNIYTEGVMAGYSERSVLLQAPCIYGNSGSLVYNKKGEVVGLVYALQMYPGFLGIPEAQITHTLIVESMSIKLFLQDLGLYNE